MMRGQHNKKLERIRKKIPEEVKRYCRRRGYFFYPFLLVDDGSRQAEQFLEVCSNAGCLFDPLFDNVFICGKHFTVHICHSDSRTCLISRSPHGATRCAFSSTDLSKHRNIVVGTNVMGVSEMESFDERAQGNRYGEVRVTRNLQPKKAEKLSVRLGVSIREFVSKLCDAETRKKHNDLVNNGQASKQNKLITCFSARTDLETVLAVDLACLCETILRNTNGRQQTLLLLKNINSFLYLVCYRLIYGIFNKGEPVLIPAKYAHLLDPMPSHVLMDKVFGLPLLKHANCMKCIQEIIEKPSFAHQLLAVMHVEDNQAFIVGERVDASVEQDVND